MFGKTIYSNDYVNFRLHGHDIYIIVSEIGYSFDKLQEDLLKNPRIKVTEFSTLKNTLLEVSSRPIMIGVYKPEIEINISNDHLKVYAKINLTQKEFDQGSKQYYLDKILELLKDKGIIYGIQWQNLLERIEPGTPILLALGRVPENGKDALIKTYVMKMVKPVIKENGGINYYELDLIDFVQKGDWLGERVEPTEGIPGKTVFGEIIPSQKGEQISLKYDTKTVEKLYDEATGITTLVAKKSGVVLMKNDIVSVSEYLNIDGNVSFSTGNIHYDGSVNIKNTIEDNFSVIAKRDIQVLGDIGIGAVNILESYEGNIYIRGGIAGKNKAKIICKGNLFTKFAANCTIECEGVVHIGFYAMNCQIKAKEIVIESMKGKIIGGTTQGKIRVESGEIGSAAGTKTNIIVEGFKRSDIKKDYDYIVKSMEMLKGKSAFLKKKISIYALSQNLSIENRHIYELLLEENEKFRRNLKILGEEKKKCLEYLKVLGEGEIQVKKGIYSNVILQIRNEKKVIMDPFNFPIKYYWLNNEIKWS